MLGGGGGVLGGGGMSSFGPNFGGGASFGSPPSLGASVGSSLGSVQMDGIKKFGYVYLKAFSVYVCV